MSATTVLFPAPYTPVTSTASASPEEGHVTIFAQADRLEPRSRRPHYSPHAVSAETEELIIRLREQLSKEGLAAGAEAVAAHPARETSAVGLRCRPPRPFGGSCLVEASSARTAETAAILLETCCATNPRK